MRLPQDLSWRGGLFWLVIFAAAGILVAAFVIVSGLYNVSATVKHFAVTERLIKLALNRSIAAHSRNDPPADLDREDFVKLGARHFELGCAPCHGAPGDPRKPIMQQMYPAPPDLAGAVSKWKPGELAWIVENGLKFTGMPAWAGHGRKDEVWPLVAFLRRLPGMKPQDYARHAGAIGAIRNGDPKLCSACHGDGEREPVADTAPALAGQPRAYLRRALLEYRSGERQSGMMEPLAAALDDAAIERLAAHFASEPVASDRGRPTGGEVGRGRVIATSGRPDAQVPPCLACHGKGASTQFPRLHGLSADYILTQLRLFQSGVRDKTAFGAVMATVARRLTPDDMDDVAAYFAASDRPGRAGNEGEAPGGGR
ncbi:c-type cytochrome [Nitratireductor sp. ZSWI3]|uniref:c-type cytochrome n=1 Tax=Nitratireductor sp. ZSWI3 TaxID=2966359 RepID=UPI00214F6F4D|nr:c-type cytochrome [Nitratireductor sp. ZSWI3]MCR4264677.1 c-type cytochrome [Nitratireductor sp. ZSWI3]